MSAPLLASALVVSTVVTTACGAGVPNPFTATPQPAEPSEQTWSSDAVLRSEILERSGNDLTAMAVIRRLRPGWLRARGQDSLADPEAAYPLVYIDEIRHGGLGTLHRIPSSEIQRIEFFAAADATTRWGTGHPSGVINVVTGR